MRVSWYFSLLFLSIVVGGCAGISPSVVQPPIGLIFTNYKAPLSTNLQATPAEGKVGTSGAFYFREPFLGTSYAWGDASIQAAAKNGNLTQIDYADYEFLQILGFFSKVTVRVHGN